MKPIYSESELFENFEALRNTYNFNDEIEVFELRKFQLLRKRKAKQEMEALFFALWKLALKQSFPENSEKCFANYLNSNNLDVDAAGNATIMFRNVEVYNTLLTEHGTRNFSNVADFLTDLLVQDSERKSHITLKLALSIRSTYNLLFDKLI